MVAACAGEPDGLAGFATSEITVGDVSLTVALADTGDRRYQGLSGIESLPDRVDGMLFVWDEPASVTFSMRDTAFPLDIWWFDDEGVLLGTNEMTTCLDGACVGYRSPGPVLWALETPQGDYGFEPGALLSTG